MKGRYASRLMLHPVTPIAISLLIVNDHMLKQSHPGVVTGKLSDVAGLIVFPLAVLSILDLVAGLGPKGRRSTVRAIIFLSAIGFVGIQVSPAAASIYQTAVGALQFPFRALAGATKIVPVEHTADLTDVLAIPALIVPWLIATRADISAPADYSRSERPPLLTSNPALSSRLREPSVRTPGTESGGTRLRALQSG